MIETFTLKNFRCFKDTSLSPLSHINLITGKNNCGKTAFLEGLFLHLGGNNPELPLNINVFRGIGKLLPHAQEIWGWLFSAKEVQQKIHLISYDSSGQKKELSLSLESSQSSILSAAQVSGEKAGVYSGEQGRSEDLSTDSLKERLVLNFRYPDGSQSTVAAQIENNQIQFQRKPEGSPLPFPPSIFMATRVRNYTEDAERYSRLQEAGLHHEIIEALREIEPRLKSFIVSVAGGIASLRADLGEKRLIPISYMGEGMNRLLSIALAIPICQHGALLIDELENGIHHSSMDTVFRSIYKLAQRFHVQLFATTHSWECIKAAHEVYVNKDVYDFRLFEFSKSTKTEERNTVQIQAYDQDSLGKKLQEHS